MRIALISYEFAGVSAGGGIGTYVRNAAKLLSSRGHDVEVFCGPMGEVSIQGDQFRVFSVRGGRSSFAEAVAVAFTERHRAVPFDVIEGPEFGAEAYVIRSQFPDVPLVVRLHTPSVIIDRINASYVSAYSKFRFMIGAFRRGQWPKPFWSHSYDAHRDREYLHVLDADLIVAPSRAILETLDRVWPLERSQSMIVPNVFIPSSCVLDIPVRITSKTVLFIGRLEVRKGVLELARAVPLVVRKHPDVQFVVVGRSLPMPASNRHVAELMQDMYGRSASNVLHLDSVEYRQVPDLISKSGVTVFPSVWESFGYVCLEAMAAGKAVIGSAAGGMAEIIDHGRTGVLVPPRNPSALASAIVSLLDEPDYRLRLGESARRSVLVQFDPDVIGPLQEESYRRAIANAAVRRLL